MTLKMRFGAAAVLVAVALAMPFAVPADELSASDLVKKVYDAAPRVAFIAKGTLSSDRGWIRELEMSHKRLGNNTEAGYMEVTAPMDLKDTRFLILDRAGGRDEQYIYVPAARRAMRVGDQTKKQDFLGSEFTVGDFGHPDVDAYTYSYVGDEEVGGRHCKLVESVPKKPTEEQYSKTISSIDPNDLLVMKTQFFDAAGKLFKVLTIEKLEKVDGIWTPLQQLMTNVLENHWSRFAMTEVKYNAQVPDETFNKSYLIR